MQPLSSATVAEIRALGGSTWFHRQIAAEFGVSRQTVTRLLSGQRHYDPPVCPIPRPPLCLMCGSTVAFTIDPIGRVVEFCPSC
jgi:hypothetical protein